LFMLRVDALSFVFFFFFVNGRVRFGVVVRGAEDAPLRKELVQKFGDLRDTDGGARVVRRVFTRDELYKGPYFEEAPDLVVGFERGYRVSWQTSLGGIPPEVFEPNERRWSADHCSVDPAHVPGVLFSSRPLGKAEARIIDIAPSVLTRLGVTPPAEMDGVDLELR
jgi:predicted AlkP superfamily phosphohydrolase/phosphomutase